MKASSTTIRIRRPGNRNRAAAAPIGMPASAASVVAVRLIASDSATISINAASAWTISKTALRKPAVNSDMEFRYHLQAWMGT